MRIVPSLCVLAALAGGAGDLHAEAAPAAADTAIYPGPEVTVRAARPRASTGGASAVEVALDSTAVRPAPTLEQVLRTLPLVVIRANSRGEAQPALRGGEDRQIAVLVDGVPITLGWDHRSDLSVVPLTAARSVTLHRGLSSLLLGPNAVGGAVEVDISRGPRTDDPPPSLTLDAGVDHTGARSAAIGAGALRGDGSDHWLVCAGAGYRGSDGFVLPGGLNRLDPATRARLTDDGDLRLNTDVEAFDGFLSLRRAAAGGAWTSLTATGFRARRGVAPESNTAEPRLWRYPYQARGLAALSAGTAMHETPWGRGDLEASLGLDLGRTEIAEYGALDYRTVTGGERDDDRTLTVRLLGDHTLGEPGMLRFGLTSADIAHREVIDGGPAARYRQRLWSLASETDWHLGAGNLPLRLSLGAAADGADTPESAGKPALGRLWDWAGRAGTTAALREGRILVHGSSSRRARFPALRELYSGALGRFLENPGLGPEVQWTNEAGITLRHRRGELQLVAFHQVLDDAIVRIAVATPEGNKYQRVNRGTIRGRGLELVANLAAARLALNGDLTLQHVRGTDAAGSGAELEYEPALYGGLGLEAPLPAALRLGVETHGTTAQRYVDLESGTFSTLAPSVRFDARLSRVFGLEGPAPWSRLDVLLVLENLADQPIYDQAGLPQPGRTLRLQTRLQ